MEDLKTLGMTPEELAKVVEAASKMLEAEEPKTGDPVQKDADPLFTAKQWEAIGVLRKNVGKIEAVDTTKAVDREDAIEDKKFKGPAVHTRTWTQDDIKNFSIARAAQYVLYGEVSTKGEMIGNELERDFLRSQAGIDEQRVKDMNLESMIAGGFLVPTVVSTDIIGQYTARTVVRRAGAQVLPDAPKETTVPKKTGNTTAYWVGDAPSTDVTASAITFGELSLTLRPLAAAVEIRKNLLQHAAVAVEPIIRSDITEQMALAEDLAFIQGLGGMQPTGLKNWPGIASYSTGSIGTPDFDELIDARTTLLSRNIPLADGDGNTSLWMHPNVLGYLQKHKTGVGAYDYVIDLTSRPPDRVLGYPVYTTTQIPVNLGGGGNETYIVFCGIGRDYTIADGGAIEILVDPYTLSRKLQVQLIAVHEVDGGPRRLEAFQLLTGVTTA